MTYLMIIILYQGNSIFIQSIFVTICAAIMVQRRKSMFGGGSHLSLVVVFGFCWLAASLEQ
jgi:hypothetical protein